MDFILIILAILLCVIGIAGCILPGLPGPPLNYVAVWLLQWAFQPFSTGFLILWFCIVLIISVLDYFLPIWTARRFGASREGIILSLVGMMAGIFLTPIGMIGGLIAGAILGDLLAGRKIRSAIASGAASAFGTLISVGLKLIVSGILALYTLVEAGTFLWLEFTQ